jgi:hypothetical protein
VAVSGGMTFILSFIKSQTGSKVVTDHKYLDKMLA